MADTSSREFIVKHTNRKTGEEKTTRVVITVDFDDLARRLASRAANSKGGKSVAANGGVVCRVKR